MSWLDGIEERILDAYRTKGKKPASNCFSGEYCCGLGALYNDKYPMLCGDLAVDIGTNFPSLYAFAHGFDHGYNPSNNPLSDNWVKDDSEAYVAGIRAGKVVLANRRDLVMNEG